MRILHTADWHAGRSLGRRSLDEGLGVALRELVDYARQEKVDAVLVAGDIFDHVRPPHESQEKVYAALMELALAEIPVALIAGNHDSVGHWHALKPLFQLARVSVTSQLGTRALETLQTRSGPLQLACLPWPNERLLSPLRLGREEDEELRMSWAEQVRKLVDVLCRQLPRDQGPRVLLGHLLVNGSQPSCSQRPLTIADTYAVSGEIFPGDLNYIALGHIHQPQKVGAPSKAYYAGSLRPLDFGEAGQPRGFYRVDLEAGRATEVEFVPLQPAQPLFQIEVDRAELEPRLREYSQKPGFFKVVVRLETPESGLADAVRQLLPQALIVQAQLQSTKTTHPGISPQTLLEPLETFRHYHQQTHGCAPEAGLEELFLQLLEDCQSETA